MSNPGIGSRLTSIPHCLHKLLPDEVLTVLDAINYYTASKELEARLTAASSIQVPAKSSLSVWLDTYPWHIHRVRIQGVARGISREQTECKLLPYVEPTTDWIRLDRRFPTLVLQGLPPEVVLHMGADARTLIVY